MRIFLSAEYLNLNRFEKLNLHYENTLTHGHNTAVMVLLEKREPRQ